MKNKTRVRKSSGLQNTADISKSIRIALYVINGILAICGIIIVLKATVYGAGVTPDSMHYLSCAENLRAGKGFWSYDGLPYTHWPPLFPTLMAMVSFIGLEPYAAGRFINAFSFGGIIFLSGILIHRRIKSFLLTIAGTCSILLSAALFKDSINLWSEPVFIILLILFVYLITQYLEKDNLRFLILAAVCSGLSCLERYAGLTTILTGCILIMFFNRKITLWKRFKHSFLFGIIAVLPLFVWMVRNRIVSSTNIGYEFSVLPNLMNWIVWGPLNDITAWLVTRKLELSARLIIIGIFLVILTAAKILRRNKSVDTKIVQVSGIFCLIYAAFLLTSAIVTSEPNERLWSAIFVFLVLLMLTAVEAIAELFGKLIKQPVISNFVISGTIGIWLLFYCLPIIHMYVSQYSKYGVPGVSSSYWQNAPLANWLRNNKLEGKFFTDDPDALYFLHRIVADFSLKKADDLTEYKKKLSSEENNYLIWYSFNYYRFGSLRRSILCDINEIATKFRLKPVVTLQDGGVFLIQN